MKTKNTLILVFLVLAAIVLASLIAGLTSNVSFLKWLTWGETVGFDAINLDLAVVDFSFSFHMQVNVLQVVLITVALLLYRKVK